MDNYAKQIDGRTIQFVRLLPGPIEKVWGYLADSDKRGQWFASGPLPAHVGESYQMRFKHSELSPHNAEPPEKMRETHEHGHTSTNVLLKCEPPHLLAFTFGGEKDPNRVSEVEIRLEPVDDKVRLTLTHSKIPDRPYMLGVSGGWHSHLDVLGYRMRGETPPAFWDVWRQYDGAYDKRYE